MYDSLGSISVVTGENGIPLQNYTYSPYGSCLNTENDPVNNLRFVGRYGGYKDDDTNLTYFWHRWYDERDGRWVSRDMIGTDEMNLYNYVRNRPQFYIDWYGLCPGGEPIPIPLPGPGQLPDPNANFYNIPWWQQLQPIFGAIYGNYCGAGWSEGKWKKPEEEGTYNVVPIDSVDNCCAEHDKCAFEARKDDSCDTRREKIISCNKKLANCFSMHLDNAYARRGYELFIHFPAIGAQ